MVDYRKINYEVMTNTMTMCESLPELQDAIRYSKAHQFLVLQEDSISAPDTRPYTTQYIVSGKRSFEAAKGYPNKKVAVLNFANNHSVGGSPYSAGAQEESLCRCSTLYPCLLDLKKDFYDRHARLFDAQQLDFMGNDDLIYTPDVVVFKTDERAEIIYPKMMYGEDWYKVDIITSAAPQLDGRHPVPAYYEECITSRIRKIVAVAAAQGVEVLILGAWGCGAFHNPSDVVARVFHNILMDYHFETVEFALSVNPTGTAFAREFSASIPEPLPNQPVTTPHYNRPYTDGRITHLRPNQVFVFGSNIHGMHAGGAARIANQQFGAEWGVGVGMTGQCYAIPTMEGGIDYIKKYVDDFIDYAAHHPEKEFLVTRIACGIAGFTPDEIAPLFYAALPYINIILPRDFVAVLERR